MLYKERTLKTNLRGSQSGSYLLSRSIPQCSTIGDAELNDPVPSPLPAPLLFVLSSAPAPSPARRRRAHRRPPRASDAFFSTQRPPLTHDYIKSMVSLIRCTIARLFLLVSLFNTVFGVPLTACINFASLVLFHLILFYTTL